jgi:hypothetical protein
MEISRRVISVCTKSAFRNVATFKNVRAALFIPFFDFIADFFILGR